MSSAGAIAVYSGASPYISFHDGTTARTAYFQEAGGRFYFGEVTYTESEGSFRAPLFYDSNDTSYYLDPANTGTSLLVAGKVGIGTTAPVAKLHIGSDLESNMSNQTLFVQGSKTGYAGFAGLPMGGLMIYDDTASTAGAGGAIGFGANTGSSQRTWIAAIESRRDSATNDASNYAGSLVFYTRPAQATPEERMRIKSDGNVGIGRTSPQQKLHIAGTNARLAISNEFYICSIFAKI